MIDDTRGDDAFAERIAEPLREPERADATFEARAMSAVHAAAWAKGADTRYVNRPWLLRPRMLRLSPLASLAVAAGFAGLVLAGSAALDSLGRDTTTRQGVATTRDTVHIVRFVFLDASARRVALVGAFNQWEKGATILTAAGANGVWTVDVALPPGRHEYAFIVTDERGERWVADPLSQRVLDDFGTESSVLAVGVSASS